MINFVFDSILWSEIWSCAFVFNKKCQINSFHSLLTQQSANVMPNIKPEQVDDAGEVEQMEPEADQVPNSEMDGVPEEATKPRDEVEEQAADEETTEKKPVLCTMEQMSMLAKQIGTNWKILAPKLGFRPDEVNFTPKLEWGFLLYLGGSCIVMLESEIRKAEDDSLYEPLRIVEHVYFYATQAQPGARTIEASKLVRPWREGTLEISCLCEIKPGLRSDVSKV